MLQQYQLQFGFREPFQLLIDDTFALALTRYKTQSPLQQFGNVLQTKEIKPLITQCCMEALYALGKEHQSTVTEAKTWERRLCNHREAIDPQECVKQCVGPENKHRYVVASEQGKLRRDLRLNVPAVPMMHFTQAVMVLEPMSPLTKSKIDQKEDTKLSLPASEARLLKNQPSIDVDIIGGGSAEQEQMEEGEESKAEGSRRRKRKAPNPLSVRKPKNPRLTMEDKLKREQELKKQKQRNAARARLEASKLDGKSTATATAATSEHGAVTAQESRRKRKRSTGKKSAIKDDAQKATATSTPKPKTETQSNKAKDSNGEANGDSKRRKRRSRPSAANGNKGAATAEAAVAESSA